MCEDDDDDVQGDAAGGKYSTECPEGPREKIHPCCRPDSCKAQVKKRVQEIVLDLSRWPAVLLGVYRRLDLPVDL